MKVIRTLILIMMEIIESLLSMCIGDTRFLAIYVYKAVNSSKTGAQLFPPGERVRGSSLAKGYRGRELRSDVTVIDYRKQTS